jgi:excinuclease ABC subunit C
MNTKMQQKKDNRKNRIEAKLRNAPTKAGCYLFRDKSGSILYVGKAASLRSRVRSYFQESRPWHPKLNALIKRVWDIDLIVTDSEVEALILENNLIKEHLPRYNVNLKDDKSYPFIRITNDYLPRVFITRKIIRDGSEYYGPYTDVKNMRFTLKTLERLFPIRSCKYDLNPETITSRKVKVCLDYYINKCRGPCQGLQSPEEYGAVIDRVRRFLKGRTDSIVTELRQEMAALSARREFEEAALIRDKISALENYRNSQKIVQQDKTDRDVIGLSRDDEDACAVLFRIREGKVIGRIHKYLDRLEWKENNEVLETFLNTYYMETEDIPAEIFLQEELPSAHVVEDWLSQKKGSRVQIQVPKIGEKKKLVDLTAKNARFLLEELKLQKSKTGESVPFVLRELKKELNLPTVPRRIECFDISNIQGSDPVAGMVTFIDARPRKSEYRRFMIRSRETPDDFAMMREAVERRYSRVLNEKKPLPDLILIDGGKGQLSSALAVLTKLRLQDVPVIGLAKRLEEIFIPGHTDAQMLSRSSPALRLLQQIRDETHRFAVTYHRLRRTKRTVASELETSEGVGPQRRLALIKAFGSVKAVRSATPDDLRQKGGLPQKTAEAVYRHFHPSTD